MYCLATEVQYIPHDIIKSSSTPQPLFLDMLAHHHPGRMNLVLPSL